MSDEMLNEIRGASIESYQLDYGWLRLDLSSGRTLTIESEPFVADIGMTLAKSPNGDSERRPPAPGQPKLDDWVDAFYTDDADNGEADDFCIKAGVDEHGWLSLLVDDGRVLRLRPSQVLAVLAGGMA